MADTYLLPGGRLPRSRLPRSVPAVLLAGLAAAGPAEAVKISAYYYDFNPGYTNSMALAGKSGPGILNPGSPNYTGAPSLAAAGVGPAVTDTYAGFAYGSGATPVQMTGDAISSVQQTSPGVYDLSLTLTNFTLQSNNAIPASEYVYVNIWEDFTGLAGLSSASWTGGTVSITGSWAKTVTTDGVGIEPTATVWNGSNWIQAAPFFGGLLGGPLSGPIAASAPVNALTPYVIGGNLSLGFETILLLSNQDAVPGELLVLPGSLHFNVTLAPQDPSTIPAPGVIWLFTSGLGLLALGRRQRRS
jgi:hypothetical protein